MASNQLPEQLVKDLTEKFPGIEVSEQQTVTVAGDELIPLITELKDNPDYDFNFLTNLTGVDHPEHFETVYNLVSFTHGYTLMVKAKLDKEKPEVPSLCSLWKGANWQEREIYDLMGIVFTGYPGHPTRILLDDGFEGHPLRKDFQWQGGRE